MARKKHVILNNDSARNIAVNSLFAFDRRRQYIQTTLDDIFRTRALDPRERRLAHELAFGSCRYLITLDHLLSRHSRRPLRHIEPLIRQILRVGLYQLVYLDQTPNFAAIHQAVQQARDAKIRGADAFVNAVLRSVQRDMEGTVTANAQAGSSTLQNPSRPIRPRATLWRDEKFGCQFKTDFLPDANKNLVKHYSLAFAHPPWLVDRWLKRFDQQTVRAICLADNARPALTLRVNHLKCSSQDLLDRLTEANFHPQCLGPAIQMRPPAVPKQLPGYQEGLFSVQDITAISVAPRLAPQPGQRILDLCAGPGGKTTHLAELMDNHGTIVACDISSEKLDLVEENCRRLGIAIVQTARADKLDDLIKWDGLFDRVLVDVPCSNTGVLARRIEARHLIKPAALQCLACKQLQLLKRAAQAANQNGKILYSTCSIDTLENESVVQKFLQDDHSFHLSEQELNLPYAGADQVGPNELPWHDGGYVALLERS